MNLTQLLRLILALAGAVCITLVIPDQGATSGLSLFPPAAAILVAVATGRLLDCALDVVLRHVFRARVLDREAQRRVRVEDPLPAQHGHEIGRALDQAVEVEPRRAQQRQVRLPTSGLELLVRRC